MGLFFPKIINILNITSDSLCFCGSEKKYKYNEKMIGAFETLKKDLSLVAEGTLLGIINFIK